LIGTQEQSACSALVEEKLRMSFRLQRQETRAFGQRLRLPP